MFMYHVWSFTLMIVESKFTVNCHQCIYFHICKKINSCLESFTVLSRKLFRRCLTFDAVYSKFCANYAKNYGQVKSESELVTGFPLQLYTDSFISNMYLINLSDLP